MSLLGTSREKREQTEPVSKETDTCKDIYLITSNHRDKCNSLTETTVFRTNNKDVRDVLLLQFTLRYIDEDGLFLYGFIC